MNAGGQRDGGRVEEMQGLYGPYSFSEKLLQKLWCLGLFDRRGPRLLDGRRIEVLSPGRWNMLGGPDFRGAHLRIDGVDRWGDVEVHFDAADWWRHGHDRDPAYGDVVLHVVLFEPKPGAPVPRTVAGGEIGQLVLLPYLTCSLEEFAADEAVEALAQRDRLRLADRLLELPLPDRIVQLRQGALARWRLKVGFAHMRIDRLGWEAACHQTALEILGYRFNRAAMLAVAEHYPLGAWREGLGVAAALDAGDGLWRTQGVRPANAPRRRLDQYHAWVRAVPDWPDRLRRFLAGNPSQPAGREWLGMIRTEVTGDAIGGDRFVTLVNNGFLPLMAADSGRDLFALWCDGLPGEAPDWARQVLRLAGVAGRGAARWQEGVVQGLLHVAGEEAARAWPSASSSGGSLEP